MHTDLAGVYIDGMVHVSDLQTISDSSGILFMRTTYCEVRVHIRVLCPLGFQDGKPFPLQIKVSIETRAETPREYTVWQLCLIWPKGRDEGNGASFTKAEGL